jgi:hypothetical protein
MTVVASQVTAKLGDAGERRIESNVRNVLIGNACTTEGIVMVAFHLLTRSLIDTKRDDDYGDGDGNDDDLSGQFDTEEGAAVEPYILL